MCVNSLTHLKSFRTTAECLRRFAAYKTPTLVTQTVSYDNITRCDHGLLAGYKKSPAFFTTHTA